MKKYIYIIGIVTLALLVACASDKEADAPGNGKVEIRTSLQAPAPDSRANLAGDAFVHGDQIYLYFGVPSSANKTKGTYTYNSKSTPKKW